MITLIIVVLFFGVKFDICYNYNGNILVLNCIIFKNVYIFRLNIRVINGKFYYYINSGNPKELVLSNDKLLKGFRVPKCHVYGAHLVVNITSEHIEFTSIIGGIFYTLTAFIKHNKYIILDDLNAVFHNKIGKTHINMIFSFSIKFDLIHIIWNILHTIILNKRRNHATESNRGINGMHA